jgi:hypothetical protein
MIGLRKLHRVLGMWIALLVLLQVTGGVLLRLQVSSPFFYTVHTWLKYSHTKLLVWSGAAVAVLLGLSLATQAVSGIIMYLNMKVQQAKRKAKAKAAAAANPPGA